MKIRNSTFAGFSTAFLLALVLNFGVAAQTSETKNQPKSPKIDDSAEFRKAHRMVGFIDEFESAVKNKKSNWSLIIDKNISQGEAYLKWELLSNTWKIPDKKVGLSARDFETVEEAVKSFVYAKDPRWDSTGTPRITQKGFGDEGFLMNAYGQAGQMTLTFRSANYVVSLTGTKDDIFSFGKIISDTISEQKKLTFQPLKNQ